MGLAAIGFGLGLVFGVARWCTDFRVLQTAMAAKNIESARRVPLLAAAVRLFLPLVLILPGAIAIGLPTPQSTTVVRNENGAIFHEITIVPPEIAQGHGLVPARLNPVTGSPILDPSGHPLLNYDKATPTMLLRLLPNGLLGVGMAALLASLMSGLAASLTAFTTVFTCDLYQSSIRKSAADSHYLAVSRWTVLAATLLSIRRGLCAGRVRQWRWHFQRNLRRATVGLLLCERSAISYFPARHVYETRHRSRSLCRPRRRHSGSRPDARPDPACRR